MAPTPPAHDGAPRIRSGVCLLLAVVCLLALPNTPHEHEPLARELARLGGTLLLPCAFLVAGGWFAVKDGGRVARLSAFALGLVVFASIGFGIVRGVQRQRAVHTVDSAHPRPDAIGAGHAGAEVRGSPAAHAAAALASLADASEAETAAAREVLGAVAALDVALEQRLAAALEALATERFLDPATLFEGDDFAWQRATTGEYGAAARALSDAHARLPAELERRLASSAVTARNAESLKTEFTRSWQLAADVYRAHVAAAEAYGALIDFVELRHADAQPRADGTVQFEQASLASAYEALAARVQGAEADVAAAVDAQQNPPAANESEANESADG